MKIIRTQRQGTPLEDIHPVTNAQAILEVRNYLSALRLTDPVLRYAVNLCEQTRIHPLVEMGVSPRGIAALVSMAQANAVLQERNYVIPEDVQRVFADVCAHRVTLRPQARVDGVSVRDVLAEVLNTVKPQTGSVRS